MNKKSARTKQKIEEALFALMQEQKYDDISVKEITEGAEVSRMAFYRNYRVKDDVLDGFIQTEYDQFISDISNHQLNQLEQLLNVYFSYFRDNVNILNAIVNAGIEGIVLRKQTEYFREFFESGITEKLSFQDYDIAYYSGAIFSILLYWKANGYSVSVDELTSRMVTKIENDLNEKNRYR